jgi:hypothetical protein
MAGPIRERRSRWRARLLAFGAVVGVAIVGWIVNKALDTGADEVSSKPPVAVSVVTDWKRIYAGAPNWQVYRFVSNRPITSIGRPPSDQCAEWRAWALAAGGADADESRASVLIQGRPQTAVVIDAVDVEVVRRRPAPQGTYAVCPAGGPQGSPRRLLINLDSDPPTVRYGERGDDIAARKRLLFTLAGPQTEILDLVANTARCDCEWKAEIHMVVDGHEHVEEVDDGGRPFHTVASRRAAPFVWEQSRWRRLTSVDAARFRGSAP